MKDLYTKIYKVISVLITVLVPFILLLTATRLLLTPLFIQIEYRLPNFPQDLFNMQQSERLRFAPLALDYLLNDAGISFLAEQAFEDGSPLYNERELRHMEDVKELTQISLKIWAAGLALFVALGLWARRAGWWWGYRAGISRGGMLTMILVTVLIIFITINFNRLFTEFHHIFFEGDTWVFKYSDTLIRLFPMRFWQDAFILLGVMTFGMGTAFWRIFSQQSRA